MSWMTLSLVLIGWCLIALCVAYLFGRFIRGIETPDRADASVPSDVGYLRRGKRRQERFAVACGSPAQAPGERRLTPA